MFSFSRNHQIGCFFPLRSSHMQNKGTRALVPDCLLWKIHACSLPMIMTKYCNSSFEDKTNWLVWLYKNGKKREGMNLLGSSYHINHLTACLRNFFEIKLEIAHEIAAVEALFRYFGPKRFSFFFFELLYILKLYGKHDYQRRIWGVFLQIVKERWRQSLFDLLTKL